MKVMIVDISKCNGCHNCQVACKDEHVDNDWSPYAKPQPDTGHFWLRLKETVHGQVPKVKIEYTAKPCMHCGDAPCMKVAKDGAVYRREDGLVVIDPEKARGQRQIMDVCPYGAVYWNEQLDIPQKCTGCAHLVDEGREPRCVDACPTGALLFGEESELKDLIAQAEVMQEVYGTKPRVYYLNAPKLFVAGEVYDPAADECLSDVEVTLTDEQSGQIYVQKTDRFGDYWFKKLTAGTYSLTAAKQGYKAFESNGINVTKSLKIEDIALIK
jgi:Fe-S-cluster-containing dehydrogenase component